MDESNYDDLIRQIRNGDYFIGIDRAHARQFFTDRSLSSLQDDTGEYLFIERGVVFLSFLAGPILLLSSFYFSVIEFGWWALAFIPVAIITFSLFGLRRLCLAER